MYKINQSIIYHKKQAGPTSRVSVSSCLSSLLPTAALQITAVYPEDTFSLNFSFS